MERQLADCKKASSRDGDHRTLELHGERRDLTSSRDCRDTAVTIGRRVRGVNGGLRSSVTTLTRLRNIRAFLGDTDPVEKEAKFQVEVSGGKEVPVFPARVPTP